MSLSRFSVAIVSPLALSLVCGCSKMSRRPDMARNDTVVLRAPNLLKAAPVERKKTVVRKTKAVTPVSGTLGDTTPPSPPSGLTESPAPAAAYEAPPVAEDNFQTMRRTLFAALLIALVIALVANRWTRYSQRRRLKVAH